MWLHPTYNGYYGKVIQTSSGNGNTYQDRITEMKKVTFADVSVNWPMATDAPLTKMSEFSTSLKLVASNRHNVLEKFRACSKTTNDVAEH